MIQEKVIENDIQYHFHFLTYEWSVSNSHRNVFYILGNLQKVGK